MKFKANFLYKPGNFQMDDCQIDKVVELSYEDFCRLKITPAEQSVLVENLRLLTGAGQEDHAALLNARVSEICETPEGTEIVLTDVEPEELVRFNEAYNAFMKAEQSMGPTMG